MRGIRLWRVGLAVGVMLVSGGRAARAQEQPAPAPGDPAIVEALQKKVANARVVDPAAKPPPTTRIRICNVGGYQGPGRPLMIVDGEELQHDRGHEIDPEQIESIEILRGAQAIRIYGHRAADGVVLIRMKRR